MDSEGDSLVRGHTIEEINAMPQVDLTKEGGYEKKKDIENSPKDMAKVLDLWVGIENEQKEVDNEIYYLLKNDIVETIVPEVFNPDFKEPSYESASAMEFGDMFFNEIMRIQLRSLLEEKIVSDTPGFSAGNLIYEDLKILFDINNVKEYASENNLRLEEYESALEDINKNFRETFYGSLNYLHYKLLQARGKTDNLKELEESRFYLEDIRENTSLEVGQMFESNPEIRDCMEIQLNSMKYMTNYSEVFSKESVRKIKFWKDFLNYGYSKEKALKELNIRKGGLY